MKITNCDLPLDFLLGACFEFGRFNRLFLSCLGCDGCGFVPRRGGRSSAIGTETARLTGISSQGSRHPKFGITNLHKKLVFFERFFSSETGDMVIFASIATTCALSGIGLAIFVMFFMTFAALFTRSTAMGGNEEGPVWLGVNENQWWKSPGVSTNLGHVFETQHDMRFNAACSFFFGVFDFKWFP